MPDMQSMGIGASHRASLSSDEGVEVTTPQRPSRIGHCCFAGCDLVTCRNCGESRCVRALHFCEAKCPECGHAMTYHAPSDEGCACGKCLWDDAEEATND